MTGPVTQPFQLFTDSTPLLSDPAALQARMADDGYVFLRGVVPEETLASLRHEIVDLCAQHGWLKPGADPMQAIPWTVPKVEGEADFFAVYDEVQRLESFHALAHDEAVIGLMRSLLGPTAFPHPLSICRLVFPDLEEWTTPPHQDFPNNQGTPDLYACWIPLGDCPRALGSLSVLGGSHRLGVLPLKFSLGAGGRTIIPDPRMDALTWRGGDFAAGDVIVFHSLTVHRAEPNRLDHMRISVDYRFQREGEPIAASCLRPHFERLGWDEIYAGWQRHDLQYYWRGKDLPEAEWNSNYHAARAEDFVAGIRSQMHLDQHRMRIAERYSNTDGALSG
jgi:ectoine hydroxylase-related dioxygenase (phytanoyl-CoA dioxygenase family)